MEKLEVGRTGTFRRHPDPRWDNSPKFEFTRDQTIPLVAAMGVWNDAERLQRFYHELRRRNWSAQYGLDTLGDPPHRNFVHRARNEKPNWITDSLGLQGAVATRLLAARSKGPDDVGDDLTLIVLLLMATLRFRTSGVDGARNHYSKNRPDNYGMFLETYREKYGFELSDAEMRRLIDEGRRAGWRPDCPRVLGAVRWYCRVEAHGNPGLADLYEPIIKKWFE